MNKSSKTKKTLLFRASFFIKSHSTLLFAIFAGCFLLLPNLYGVHAGFWDTITTPSAWINALIYPFFLFFSWIVNLAAGIFVWVINAATFTKLMNAGAIYEVWLIVRDFLNIFFILVLLFSAFATIFQLDKYEYKKTIPTLVIMALLVNFSFPVARFVIDLANVPMYFFSQNIFGVDGPNEITSGILSGAKMQNILIPGIDEKSLVDFSTTHLLAATICMFLFGISFLVLSVLMLVRMIALAILVMFSPIGFVGMITPALQSFAKGWWDKLFKWAFYGPIAVMFVLVAVIVMKSAGDSIYPTAGAGGVFQSTGSSVNDNMVSAVAFFTIPIVLFWIAITSAEKYSNDMSGMGIKFGSKLGRWGARTLTGYNWGMRRYGAYSAERKRRSDAKLADSMFGARLGRGVNSMLDTVRSKFAVPYTGMARGADAARNRRYQEDVRLVDETGKRLNISNLGGDELRTLVDKGGRGERGAALKELAARGNASRDDLKNIREKFGVDSQVVRDFESKMRAFDPVAVFTDSSGKLNPGRLESFVQSNQFDAKKLSAKSLESSELMRFAFKAKNISNKDLDELRAKGTEYTKAITDSLEKMIGDMNTAQGGHWDMTDDVQKNVQVAHLAQGGKFHTSISGDDSIKAALFEKADGDILKRIDSTELFSVNAATGKSNINLLAENVKGKYVDIVSKIAESGGNGLANAQAIKMEVASRIGTGNANIDRLNSLNNDHRIRYI